jgi:phosphoglycolate phosphatase
MIRLSAMKTLREHLRHKTHVIWDWNGTILNDADLCCRILGRVLGEIGHAPISVDEYREKFRFPIRNFYTEGLSVCLEKNCFVSMSETFISSYNQEYHQCELFPGTVDFIGELNGTGVKNSILSASFEPDLLKILDHFKIRDHFHFAYGIGDSFATSKVDRGRNLVEIIQEPKEEVILIGDTEHDFDVASELGIDCLLIAEGHYSHNRLSNLGCPSLPSRYH